MLLLLYQNTQVCQNFCTFCLVNKLKISIFKFCHNSEPKLGPKPLLEQLNINFNIKINHSMLHNSNNGDFPVKTNDFLAKTFSSKWQLRRVVHDNAVMWRNVKRS